LSIQRFLVVPTNEDGDGLDAKVGDDINCSMGGSADTGFIGGWGFCGDFTDFLAFPVKYNRIFLLLRFIATKCVGERTELSAVRIIPRTLSNTFVIIVAVLEGVRCL
jgi:hypothetical protein